MIFSSSLLKRRRFSLSSAPELVLVVSFALPLMAQQTQEISISGRVIDTTNLPVLDATVYIRLGAKSPVITYKTQTETITAITDSHGQFRATANGVLPLLLFVSAEADGYLPCGNTRSPASSTPVVVPSGSKAIRIDVCVARPGRISGTIVDAESGLPLSGARISAMRQGFINGGALFLSRAAAISSGKGEFDLSGLPPGDYALKIKAGPDVQFRRIASRHASPDEKPPTVITGYGPVFWPGLTTDPPDEGQTYPVLSGANDPLGTIGIHRQRLYSLLVSTHGFSCSDSLAVHIALLKPRDSGQEEIAEGEAPCGAFEIANINGGEYVLDVHHASSEPEQAYAMLSVSKNDRADVFAESIASLNGKLLLEGAPEGSSFPAALAGMTISMSPIMTYRTAEEETSSVDANGAFTASLYPNHPYRIEYKDVPSGYYVKAVRVSGIVQPEIDRFTPSRQSGLEIVLSDRPASFQGRVESDRIRGEQKPCSFVLLRRDLSGVRRFQEAIHIPADKEGAGFRSGLPPGDYDVICLGQRLVDSLDRPSLLDRLTVSAARVTLSEGQLTRATIPFIDK